MHARNILAIARKDARDILLNKTWLTLLFSPIVIAALFAVIGALIAGKAASLSLLIYNPDHSGVEQTMSNVFKASIVRASSPAEVAAAFGPQGTHKNTPYILGLVVPANFDNALRAGEHPQITLYINGDDLDKGGSLLVQHTLSDYARGVTSPQMPISVSVTSINPPATSNFVQDYTNSYAMFGLLYSLTIGVSFVPALLVEEKEKKTVRLLMASPASWGDVVMSKLLVGLGYQLLVSGIVMLILGGFAGQVLVTLLFLLLSSCFGLVLGLLFGCICQTNGSVGVFVGIISLAYTLPPLVLGPLHSVLQGSLFEQGVKVLPPYYMADAFLKALQNQATADNVLLDMLVLAGSTAALFFITIWGLHRQSAIAGAI